MSKTLSMTLLALVLASCGSTYRSPPKNLDNACSIADQRPQYMKAFKATERKWGVPVSVQMAIIHQESRYRGDARTPYRYVLGVIPMGRQSSAFGYSQALDGTWEEYLRETGRRSAKRDRINDASDFIGWYTNRSRKKNGIALDDARNQYLAYHQGNAGYARGSYKSKGWLLKIAANVDARANMYESQLKSCGGIFS
jgi:hypothetical protein